MPPPGGQCRPRPPAPPRGRGLLLARGKDVPSWLRSPPYHAIGICNQNRAKPPSVPSFRLRRGYKINVPFCTRTRAALTPRAGGPCRTATPDPLARLYRVLPGSHRQPATLLYNSLISLFPVHPTRTLAQWGHAGFMNTQGRGSAQEGTRLAQMGWPRMAGPAKGLGTRLSGPAIRPGPGMALRREAQAPIWSTQEHGST